MYKEFFILNYTKISFPYFLKEMYPPLLPLPPPPKKNLSTNDDRTTSKRWPDPIIGRTIPRATLIFRSNKSPEESRFRERGYSCSFLWCTPDRGFDNVKLGFRALTSTSEGEGRKGGGVVEVRRVARGTVEWTLAGNTITGDVNLPNNRGSNPRLNAGTRHFPLCRRLK